MSVVRVLAFVGVIASAGCTVHAYAEPIPVTTVQTSGGATYVGPAQPQQGPVYVQPAQRVCPPCVQGAQETCNGCDDNCNGVIDEGC